MYHALRAKLALHLFNHSRDWVASGFLQRLVIKDREGKSFSPQTIGRTLREMEAAREIAVKYAGAKYHAHYKHLPDQLIPFYITTEERKDKSVTRLFTISDEDVKTLLNKYVPKV